jgi:tetratricopeptide (TPR) repeat protein
MNHGAVKVGLPAAAGGAAFAGGGLLTDIADLQAHLREEPTDSVGWATLGMDYVQQAKASNDSSDYPKAEGVLRRSLDIAAQDNFVAMAGMAALESARHDFAQALSWAQRAAAIDPYNSTVYGILGDAYTQLGRYLEAYRSIQRMVDLEPGTPSLSRASYTWELRGNLPEATADMQRALDDAATPADRAFARYYLGELAFNAGDPHAALAQALAGLRDVPGNPPLLEGKAKAEAALGDTASAVADFTRVVGLVPQPQYVIELGELYQALGNTQMAQQEYSLFRSEEQLFAGNGVTLDTDPTLFNADHGDAAQALRYGEAGLKARPFVEMDDAYAWALHKNGHDAAALVYARKATGLGMRCALFYFHRGMIEAALGQNAAARADLTDALRINPWFNPLQAPVAHTELARLAGKP